MPVPANTPELTLGRGWFDARKFRTDTDPAILDAFKMLQMITGGSGAPGPAKKDDAVYLAVFAQPDGLGAHNLYGGNPADPVNPYPLTVSASGSATVNWEEEGVLVLSSGTANFVGSGVTVTDVAGTATITISAGGGSVTEAFKTIAVSGQSDIVADSATDTLTVAAGTGIVITTTAGTDTLTFAIDTAAVAQNSFTTIAVSGQSNVVADSPTDTLTLVGGTNIVITTNAASDTITITSSDTTYTAGLYLDLNGTTFDLDLTEVADYSAGATQLLGHVSSVIAFDTVGDWLKTLPSYDVAKKQVLTHDLGTVEWNDVDAVLNWLGSYNSALNQSIGHDAAGATVWQEDGTACP